MAAHVGFGDESLWGSWQTPYGLEDEIQVQAAVLWDARGEKACIAVADVCGMWPSTCLRLREAIARQLNTQPARAAVLCTQNHGAPMEGPGTYDLDKWERAFVGAARAAEAAARPAEMAYVEAQPLPPRVVNRRKRFDDLGSFTFYYGFDVTPDGLARCAQLLETAMRGLWVGPERTLRHLAPEMQAQWPDPPVPLPPIPPNATLDGPADTLIQGVFFRTLSGEPIGSICRWAAHPVTANAIGVGHSGDYPAYARRRLSSTFGGGSLFLTGPCGDQAPLVDRKSRLLAERTGTWVADQLLAGLEAAAWGSPSNVEAVTRDVPLAIRTDYPRSLDEAHADLVRAREKLKRLRELPGSLGQVKATSEEIERLRYTVDGHHYSWCGIALEDLASGWVRHPLYVLRLGPVVFAGLPGEPFGDYALKLRARCPGVQLIVAEECNGYLSYIPSADEYPWGGYGPAAALLDPQAEAVLLAETLSLVSSVSG